MNQCLKLSLLNLFLIFTLNPKCLLNRSPGLHRRAGRAGVLPATAPRAAIRRAAGAAVRHPGAEGAGHR